MSIELKLSIISAIVAVLSLVGAIIIFAITRNRENYQNLQGALSFYFSPEMLMAIQALWELYREYGASEFVNKYIEIMQADNEKMKSMPPAERRDFLQNSLHYQRRMVTQFWKGLAIQIKTKTVPRKAVFYWWSQDDVSIVSKILIPIENGIIKHYQAPKYRPEKEPLYYLVKIKNKFYT